MMAFFDMTNKYNNCADDLTELCKEELKTLINFFFFLRSDMRCGI